mgnify:CR=1 FL=1
MISLRAQPPSGVEWDDLTFSGENEEMLSHLVATTLLNAGWEILGSTDGGEFEEVEL